MPGAALLLVIIMSVSATPTARADEVGEPTGRSGVVEPSIAQKREILPDPNDGWVPSGAATPAPFSLSDPLAANDPAEQV